MKAGRRLALSLTLIVASASALGLPMERVAPAALALALVSGIPHGAYDLEFLFARGLRHACPLLVMYAGVVAVICLTWTEHAPLFSAAFFAVSVWHFGEGDLRGLLGLRPTPLAILSRGLAVVGVPILADWGATRPLVEALTGVSFLPLVSIEQAAVIAGVLAVQHIVVLALSSVRPRELWESSALMTMLLLAPGLLGFAVYFGGWHAPSHILAVRGRRQSRGVLGRSYPRGLELVVGLAGVAIVGLGWALASTDGGWSHSDVLASAIVPLAALTLPHALIVECWLGRLPRRPVPNGS